MDPLSILVVDDEPGIALLCQRLLRRAGYDVTALTDPKQAVDYLGITKVDMLVVDIRMPEVDGFELITLAQQIQPGIAVLVMTGYGTVETAIRALRQGVDGLLLKPFDRGSELIDTVKQAMADSQKKRDAARTQALRPLFSITESLLSETRQDRLLDLISTAVCGYLRCPNSGYYLAESGGELTLHVERGRPFSDNFKEILTSVDKSGIPVIVWSDRPRETKFKQELLAMGIGSAIFVPVVRPRFRSVLYAARENNDTAFQESDFEMFQILARQAAAALENARLYAEQLEYVRKIEDSQKALLQIEKMAAAGRLSASIAHEVNNPLHAVQNCLHLAMREDLPADKQKEYINLARAELERLAATVQRMLAFYRPDPGDFSRINVQKTIEHILHLMARQFAERGIKVELDSPGNIPDICAVDSQLQQVVINLLLNAFDAMPNGGNLIISLRNQGKGVEIRVKDSGPGVPADEQSRIFEPFFSSKEGGTGLGLTVSYNIISAHGGTLELISDQTQGACFRVFLPIGEKS